MPSVGYPRSVCLPCGTGENGIGCQRTNSAVLRGEPMPARFMLKALVMVPLLAAPSWAQSYTLKMKEYAAEGKSIKVSDQTTVRTAFSVGLGAKVLKEEKKTEVTERQLTEKVLKGGAGKPEKFTQ